MKIKDVVVSKSLKKTRAFTVEGKTNYNSVEAGLTITLESPTAEDISEAQRKVAQDVQRECDFDQQDWLKDKNESKNQKALL